MALSLTKGMRVIVTGRLEQRSWETDEGEHRSKVEITADEIGVSLRFATADVQRTQRTALGEQDSTGSDDTEVPSLWAHTTGVNGLTELLNKAVLENSRDSRYSESQPRRLAQPLSYGGYLGMLRWGELDDVLGVAVPDGLRGSGELLVVDDPLLGELQHGETGQGWGFSLESVNFAMGASIPPASQFFVAAAWFSTQVTVRAAPQADADLAHRSHDSAPPRH